LFSFGAGQIAGAAFSGGITQEGAGGLPDETSAHQSLRPWWCVAIWIAPKLNKYHEPQFCEILSINNPLAVSIHTHSSIVGKFRRIFNKFLDHEIEAIINTYTKSSDRYRARARTPKNPQCTLKERASKSVTSALQLCSTTPQSQTHNFETPLDERSLNSMTETP
jgi:hypothetical protein